jgi:hypothetical protein
VKVTVQQAVTVGLRGEPITIRGLLVQAETERGLTGRPVELYLRKPGQDQLVKVGDALTRADGAFTLRTTIPLTTEVGTYTVMAYTPGDAAFLEAWSE